MKLSGFVLPEDLTAEWVANIRDLLQDGDGVVTNLDGQTSAQIQHMLLTVVRGDARVVVGEALDKMLKISEINPTATIVMTRDELSAAGIISNSVLVVSKDAGQVMFLSCSGDLQFI